MRAYSYCIASVSVCPLWFLHNRSQLIPRQRTPTLALPLKCLFFTFAWGIDIQMSPQNGSNHSGLSAKTNLHHMWPSGHPGLGPVTSQAIPDIRTSIKWNQPCFSRFTSTRSKRHHRYWQPHQQSA
ncbi:hypothetical protein K491DRAFT_691163 [Lophiostoma macrostomum CBS 122681]|uniref:Uncharacterized protein n=1 Tax=Lophiostoma macrostomum CBS 122681 TaxID=1314788 RepID=A0A6A6TEA8_9PLEO|nr:hypothetical protein K491DRAFT_691163 [Lophiostoma macrostomum CBS 122681]